MKRVFCVFDPLLPHMGHFLTAEHRLLILGRMVMTLGVVECISSRSPRCAVAQDQTLQVLVLWPGDHHQ